MGTLMVATLGFPYEKGRGAISDGFVGVGEFFVLAAGRT